MLQREPLTKLKRKSEDAPLPSPKYQRASRYKGINPYNFDAKFHKDYDMTLKPNATATKRAEAKQQKTPNILGIDLTMDNAKTLGQDVNNTRNKSQEQRSRSKACHEEHALRQLSCDAIPKNQPHNYKATWHPANNLETSTLRDRNQSNAEANVKSSSKSRKLSEPPATKANSIGQELCTARNGSLNEDELARPARRRSSRTAYNEEMAMKYDMNYHPSYDACHRPKDVAKRFERKRQLVASFLPTMTPTEQNTSAQNGHITRNSTTKSCQRCPEGGNSDEEHQISFERELSSPDTLVGLLEPEPLKAYTSPSDESDLYRHMKTVDWDRSNEFEHAFLLHGKGGPTNGDTFAVIWSTAKGKLLEQGCLSTWGFVNSQAGTEALMTRYEAIRAGIKAFSATEQESINKRIRKPMRVKGFDIYELGKGLRYWRNIENRTVKSTKMALDTASGGDEDEVSSGLKNIKSGPSNLSNVSLATTTMPSNSNRRQRHDLIGEPRSDVLEQHSSGTDPLHTGETNLQERISSNQVKSGSDRTKSRRSTLSTSA